MILLGRSIPDHKALKLILTSFYGIGFPTATRLMARLQLHNTITPAELTPFQTSQLVEFLTSPSSAPRPPPMPLAPPGPSLSPSLLNGPLLERFQIGMQAQQERPEDVLSQIKLETDLRRQVRENIAHHRTIGTYVGRRHAMGLPVRGQNTRNNRKTARKLNKIERRG